MLCSIVSHPALPKVIPVLCRSSHHLILCFLVCFFFCLVVDPFCSPSMIEMEVSGGEEDMEAVLALLEGKKEMGYSQVNRI